MANLLRLVACLTVLLSFNAKAFESPNYQIDSFNFYASTPQKISISGNKMVVNNRLDDNCSSGSIRVYEKSNDIWLQTSSISQSGYNFGCSRGMDPITIEGDLIAVGAQSTRDVGVNSGAVYIYEMLEGSWNLKTRLTPNDPAPYSYFGSEVRFSDGLLFISSRGADEIGAIYIYEQLADSWILQEKITPPNGYEIPSTRFGKSFDVSGNTLVISQRRCQPTDCGGNGGAIHIYDLENNEWNLKQTINEVGYLHSNGKDIAISGHNLLTRVNSTNEEIYHYTRQPSGIWEYKQKIWGSKTSAFQISYYDTGYGDNIQILGSTALISSASSYVYGGGTEPIAYLFKLQDQGGWIEQAILRNPQYKSGGGYILTANEVVEDTHYNYGRLYSYDLNSVVERENSVITGDFLGQVSPLSLIAGTLNASDVNGLTDGTYFTICSLVNNNLGQAFVDEESGAWTFLANSEEGAAFFEICVTDDIGDVTRQTINIQVTDDDTDSDSVGDTKDNCPSVSNLNQEDLDDDGTGDACDTDADGDGFTSDNDFNDLNVYLSTDPDDDGIDSSGASHYSDNVCLRSPQCNDNDPCILVCYVPPQDNCPIISNSDQSNIDGDNYGDACDSDIDGDKIINTIETAAGTNPNDPSDGDQAELSALEALGINKQVPAMGGIGLLALGLSMLGLGAVRLRK